MLEVGWKCDSHTCRSDGKSKFSKPKRRQSGL